MFYEKAAGSKASGSLIAPWQGIHGWYWQNKSGTPVTSHQHFSGGQRTRIAGRSPDTTAS